MLRNKPRPNFERTFMRPPTVVASAPGRIEFIGNHTDYNGGLVLGAAIDRFVNVAVAPRDDDRVRLTTIESWKVPDVHLGQIEKQSGESFWSNYPLGVIKVLREHGMATPTGLDMAITGDLDAGAGLSSSAALELATALAVSTAYRYELDRKTLAMLGRKAENDFVGVPCGILDQGVSSFGKKDHLVLIDCAALTFQVVPLPSRVHFWIFNTKKKHALVDSLYARRHEECMQAMQRLRPFYTSAKQLADLDPGQVVAQRNSLPNDLYKRARHVVEENQRVKDCVAALETGDLQRVGQLLFASHDSSRSLFENSTPELDFLVDQLRNRPQVFGARLTGGGFGGAVMAMTDETFSTTDAAQVAVAFSNRFGPTPSLYHVRTADGARLV